MSSMSHSASSWVEPLARCGYAAKGVVYTIVGVLAFQAAFKAGNQAEGSRGALERIIAQPFGQVLLGLVAAGLAAYALWRFVQAFMDAEHKGSDAKGVATRVGYAVIGAIYASLAYSAIKLIFGAGNGGGSEDRASQDWTAWLLTKPFGQVLVGLVGAAVITFAIYQFYKSYTAEFVEKLRTGRMSAAEQKWSKRVGQAGLAARGVAFTVSGIFLLVAAWQADASEARGLSGALRILEQQPLGPWILGIIALGLTAYGLFMFFVAKYRRIEVY